MPLSFFFFFVSFFYVRKNYTSIAIYEKASLYTYIPIQNKLFMYTRAFKTLSLYINTVYIQTLFLFEDFFFIFQLTYAGIVVPHIQKISTTTAVIASPSILAATVRALTSLLLFAFIYICIDET